MWVSSTIWGFCGFGMGIAIGLVIGYYLFVYFQPTDVKVTTENGVSRKNRIASQQHQTSKPLAKLHSTSSITYPSNLSRSFVDVNCSCTFAKKTCRIHENGILNRLNSYKDSSRHKGDNDVAAEPTSELIPKEKPKKSENVEKSMHKRICHLHQISNDGMGLGLSSDATNSQDHSDHIEKSSLDKISGVSDYILAEAIQKIESQLLTVDMGTQMPSLKYGSFKEKPMLGRISSRNNNSIQAQNNLLSGFASQNDGKSIVSSWVDQNTCNTRNESLISEKDGRTREGRLTARVLSRANVTDGRLNTGTVLTTTMGPTLLRTAVSMEPHAKKDQVDWVDKHQKLWDSNQRSSYHTENKTTTRKDQSSRLISLPTLLGEERPGKNVKSSHQNRQSCSNTHMDPSESHLPSRQKAKARTTSISTSDSSYSSWATQGTSHSESEDSRTPRRILTRQQSYLSSGRSMKHNQRMSHYGRVGPAHEADPTTHKRETGRLRRFKNKLGVIFHHHHHHHHHDDGAGSESKSKAIRTTSAKPSRSFWKYLLHRTKEDVEGKSRKHVRRPQVEAEHGVMDGVFRHIWHSKKSKQSKGLGKSCRNNKVVKNWHWWQRYHKRRGFKAKKAHLPALKLN